MADDLVNRIRREAKNQSTLGQALDLLHVAEEIERLQALIHSLQRQLLDAEIRNAT